jgi:hypothetical protein
VWTFGVGLAVDLDIFQDAAKKVGEAFSSGKSGETSSGKTSGEEKKE